MSVNRYDSTEPERPERITLVTNAALLAGSGLSILASAALLAVGGLTGHWIGYALAAAISSTCVALYRRSNVEIAGRFGIVAPTWSTVAASLLVLVGMALSVIHAWLIARHYS